MPTVSVPLADAQLFQGELERKKILESRVITLTLGIAQLENQLAEAKITRDVYFKDKLTLQALLSSVQAELKKCPANTAAALRLQKKRARYNTGSIGFFALLTGLLTGLILGK